MGWPMKVATKRVAGWWYHGFHLIMGDIDHRGVEVALQGAEFDAHLATEGGVEVREGFVEEEDLGVPDDAAANGDALALAAGELAGSQAQLLGQLQDFGGAADLLLDLGLGQAGDAEGEGDVLED